MRTLALAFVSACALAACNPSGGAGAGGQGADGGDGAFPTLDGVSYRVDTNIIGENGRTMPVIMYRDGQNMRVEFTSDEGQSAMVVKGATDESFMLTNRGGRTMALRMSNLTDRFNNPADAWGGDGAAQATRTGQCSVAGETGEEWSKTTAEDGTDTACVTRDGIFLRATDDGRTVWEATRVERGPQPASLFELPPGVQVMDLGDMGGLVEQLERAKRGQ